MRATIFNVFDENEEVGGSGSGGKGEESEF